MEKKQVSLLAEVIRKIPTILAFIIGLAFIYLFYFWKPCGVGLPENCGLETTTYSVLEVKQAPKFGDASISLFVQQSSGNWSGLHGGAGYFKCFGEQCNFLKIGDSVSSCSTARNTCDLGD